MRIFLGSSSECMDELRLIESWLQSAGAETLPWDKPGLFMPGNNTFQTLVEITTYVDAAVFIFGDEDKVWYRGDALSQPRDNVLIEYGLFAGALGAKRAIICEKPSTKTATDLNGITTVRLNKNNDASNRITVTHWVEKLQISNHGGDTREIYFTGQAKDLYVIKRNAEFENAYHQYLYKIRNGKLTIQGGTVTLSAQIAVICNEESISEGEIIASGSMESNSALLHYEIIDPHLNQHWKGVLMLRVPGIGPLWGYWVTDSQIEPSMLAFGAVELQRTNINF
jgi:hypothetical protein